MCGFVAVISKGDRPVCERTLRMMSRDIIHRGPDDSGIWLSDWCGLGARRLSIIDLSERGHQPMFDRTGTFAIVYNGEVYNFSSLRKELEDTGVQFASSSDTEVVLQSYIRWGESCIERFTGMFAFMIANTRTREVFVARDHLGIKPLYHSENRDYLVFASEIKALRHLTAFELNHDVLYEQLVFRYVAGESTPLKNVFRFPAGSYWSLKQGNSPQRHRYYDVTRSLGTDVHAQEDSYLGKLSAAVAESIKIHTASDVGYNIQLSGGVDSSFITALLATDSERQIDTYSIVFPDQTCDESQYARQVSHRYSTRHHEMVVEADTFAGALERATWHMDVPIVHLGCVLLMLLCDQSAETSKVVLTGEGADELFAGYTHYDKMLDYPNSYQGSVARFLKRYRLTPRVIPNIRRFRGLKAQLSHRLVDTQRTLKRGVIESFIQGVPESTPYRDEIVSSQSSPIAQCLAHDQACYLPSLLERQDKMSMAASVEARVPFCNPHLFDMVNPVPADLKLKDRTTKYLLKKMGEKYLDHSLLYRRKNGLQIPLDEWLRQGPLSDRLTLLTDQTARERGFYDVPAIESAIDHHRSGERNFGRYLAAILMFEIWARMFTGSQVAQPVRR